jgi:hypothetical protein
MKNLFFATLSILGVLLTLTSCGPSSQPFLGTWYMLTDYATLELRQDGKNVLIDSNGLGLGGQTLNASFQDTTLLADVPMIGRSPVTLKDEGKHLEFMTWTFTKDKAEAETRYLETARTYGINAIKNGYYVIASLHGEPNPDCPPWEKPRVVSSCHVSWNKNAFSAQVDLTTTSGASISVSSQELGGGVDFPEVAGRWETSATDESNVSLSMSPGQNNIVGVLEGIDPRAGGESCRSYLKALERTGLALRVEQVGGGTAADCPGTGEEHYLVSWQDDSKKRGITYTLSAHWKPGFYINSPPDLQLQESGRALTPVPNSASAEARPSKPVDAAPTQSGNTVVSPNPSTTEPPSKLEIVTPDQDPKNLGVQRLYDFAGKTCDQVGNPDETKKCQITVDASQSFAWGSAWCATKASATSSLLNSTGFQYFIDGKSIPSDQFWTGQTSTCLRRRLIVKNLEPGSHHEFKLVIRVTRDVSDGSSVYKAGRYELQLDVTAQ